MWAANNTCANALKVVPQKYHGSDRSIGHRRTTKEDITPLTGHMDKLETATGLEGRLVCGRRVVIRELLQGPVSLAGFSKPEKKAAVGQSRDSLHCIAAQLDADTEHCLTTWSRENVESYLLKK